ncbi:GDI1 [Hepatospora eriocheir]|uniref:Rab GDP dissociation inhibitor n=1 Tax=Hepatospora eriocheir TaxID=1081669 RepID=A0A1X0QJM3_9MICR|nr:GDI1 [Hepatospora eriocheir]
MNNYDYIILETGPVETILSCILAKRGKKVLVVDSNKNYGSEFATYNLHQLEDKLKKGYFIKSVTRDKDKFNELLTTKSHQWNIDMCPKLLLLESNLKDLLLEYEIDSLVEFSPIVASYIFSDQLHPIPRNEITSIKSNLIGFLEKGRLIRFFYNIRSMTGKLREKTSHRTMRDEFEKYNLSTITRNFIGHAIAMNTNDDYLDQPAYYTYKKIISYIKSVTSYDSSESPFVYPNYGLCDICEGFVRKASLSGAAFMLNSQCDINEGIVKIIDGENNTYDATYKKLILNPNQLNREIETNNQIYIVICICLKNYLFTGSRNITFLRNEVTENDIFCIILDQVTKSCPDGYEIVILSTKSSKPQDIIINHFENHIFNKMKVIKAYFKVTKTFVDVDTHKDVILTKGLDESPLMDTIYDEVIRIIKLIDQ